jgi:rhodanese-related sulfurtransferase
VTVFDSSVPSVSPRGVSDKLADGWTLLDVRTDGEWAQGRIAGALHIPMDELLSRLDEVEDRVVCVCAVGARSGRVAEYLNAQGYQAVNLEGGIYGWADAGLPIER